MHERPFIDARVHRRSLAALAVLAVSCLCTAQADGVRTIDVEAARAAVRAGDMLLVDIRTPAEWRATGIPDVAVALDMRDESFQDDLDALRRDAAGRTLGFICASGGRSGALASHLARRGMAGVADVEAGVVGRDGWRARGLPLRAPGAPPVGAHDRGETR